MCFVQLTIYFQLLHSIFIKVAYLFLKKPNSGQIFLETQIEPPRGRQAAKYAYFKETRRKTVLFESDSN